MRLKYRPLAIIGFTVLLVLFLSVYVNSLASVICAAGGILLFVCSVVFKKLREKVFPFFIAGALILGSLIFTVGNDYDYDYVKSFADSESCTIEGIFYDYPDYSNQRYYYLIKTDKINGKPCETTVRLSMAEVVDAEPYDTVKAVVSPYLVGKNSGLDVEMYFRSKGVYIGAYVGEDDAPLTVEKSEARPVRYYILKIRQEIERRILDKLPNEYGGTAIALLLGDKGNISNETQSQLYKTGTAPVFAVSGLHLSIWVLGLYEILHHLGVKRRLNSLIVVAFTLFFMALTGFSASVCRSGLMMLLLLFGNLVYRKADSLNSLGFATMILCCLNPYIAADTGFMLSFSATLGIVSIMPVIKRHLLDKIKNRYINALLNAISVSCCAFFGSLPIMIVFLENIAVFGIISNLLITYVAGLCMVFSGLTVILFKIPVVSSISAFIVKLCAKYILTIIKLFASLSITTVSTADIFWKGGAVVGVVVVIFAWLFLWSKVAFKFTCVGLCLVITVSTVSSMIYYDGLTQVEILNVGDGIAVVAAYDGKKLLLLNEADSYNATYVIEDCLDSISSSPANLLLLSDKEASECGTTVKLLKDNEFNKVVLPEDNCTVSSLVKKENIITVKNSDLNVWDTAVIKYYNDGSAVYAYCTFGAINFLVIFSADKSSEINSDCTFGDILICSGTIPNNINPADFSAVVVSSTEKKSQSICKYVSDRGGESISTANSGNISVKIKNEEFELTIKEE